MHQQAGIHTSLITDRQLITLISCLKKHNVAQKYALLVSVFTSLTENFELGTSLAVASILATVTVLFSAKASPTCVALQQFSPDRLHIASDKWQVALPLS